MDKTCSHKVFIEIKGGMQCITCGFVKKILYQTTHVDSYGITIQFTSNEQKTAN
jgi:hypothetical protein